MPDTIDRTTLPDLFLDLAKAQARIDHDDDDALVVEQLAQAIDDVERLANVTIFERTFTLTAADLAPSLLQCWAPPAGPAWLALPFNNVSAWSVADGNGADISADFTLRQRDPGGTATSWLQGPTVAPLAQPVAFDFTAGMATLADIAPGLRRLILRRFSALYEYREAALPLSADDLAGEPGLWRPDL